MDDHHEAVATAILPQYQGSSAFMERFLVAAHEEGAAIERSVNNEKIKRVDQSELDADILTYFDENKTAFRTEFTIELEGCLRPEEFNVFC